MEQLFTLRKTAEFTSLSETTLRRAIKRGDLKAEKYCNRYLITHSALQEWKDRQKALQGDRP